MRQRGFAITMLSCALLIGSGSSAQAAGWLGLGAGPVQGIEVRELVKDGPADKAGLQQGDLVLTMNGQDIMDLPHFLTMVGAGKPGTSATLTLMRQGAKMEVNVTFDDSARHTGTPQGEGAPLGFRRGVVGGYYPGALLPAGHTHDLQARMQSVRSLLEAYDRIRIEKKVADGVNLGDQIRELLTKAERDKGQYQMEEAHAAVEQAYALARQGLQQLRGGETLVNHLTFRTPQDEYTYELNRNNMFQLLLRGLSDGGRELAAMPEVQRAVSLRKKAEGAAKGNLAKGIKLLEESSNLYMQALMGAEFELPEELRPR